jgi:hypothetical protein
VHILTDDPSRLCKLPNCVIVHDVTTGPQLLSYIQFVVRQTSQKDLLFIVSGHGYSEMLSSRQGLELNHRSEYIQVKGQRVYDYQLFAALYTGMSPDTTSLCLLDTCHSGTLLDLEYLSTDGRNFSRSKTRLENRPLSVCISACNDDEQAGEDISDYGGWGGKLICQFLDFLSSQPAKRLHVLDFYLHVRRTFRAQGEGHHTHPIISYSDSSIES